jgi:hypothetical protein
MNRQRHLVMVGLPESGKSTYLGALFRTLSAAPPEGLHLARDPEERDYLLDLERRWLSLTPLERSPHHGGREVTLDVATGRDADELTLVIPDVVGEDYLDAWLHGSWTDGLRDRLVVSDGILLFVRADTVNEADLISVDPRTDGSQKSGKRWDPMITPTQAMLCDLLEQISATRGGTVPPIGVVVAAWDAVAELELSAADWLAWKTPLLSQWLRSNESEVPFCVFGISAQGGDLHDESVRQQLADHIENRPLPRLGSPLIAPLQWLLDLNRG